MGTLGDSAGFGIADGVPHAYREKRMMAASPEADGPLIDSKPAALAVCALEAEIPQ
ncbi:hypothetical protein CBM2625_U10037 [Cupriavidus taiwanensis]|uniref:Uncharacterized protein n=1 Tax=Cupriavidus taiwanensis TaxID=164546 RepID=A0A375FFF2_9BURK|nr:hypothetical protein CBM2625_U10037 [Cupriavidus taiwanensis]SPA57646.1 hypothetical protein CBM2638_U10010 [Cupriavidus taiwanensis]SPD48978.1 protein of unknown function [Cupriavidus taiwanensis]